MTDKRQTTGAWVAPVAVQSEQSQSGHAPTHKGEISTGRILGFLALSFAVAAALGWLAFTVWGANVALAVFVVIVLVTFTPYFLIDSVLSSGYWHERARLIVEDNKTFAAIQTAGQVNAEQQAQIEQLWTAISHLDERIKAMDTIAIRSREGVRVMPKRDDVDMSIDRWLASMFDANGQMVGTFPSGVIKGKYPFKGDADEDKQAHARLIRAGLVGQNSTSKQYTWTGPITLSETRKRLQTPT